ncbi:hypothetical protein pdul_cds_169 [Pandoravirus dulcis]|uniref:Uncharacterized protein n=1 Tax=Pandoravirus dulcis TaxID=1349409 RepID=S4VVX2_9VIRU|nr:hypothetical protein pdul_cds_169 [Pandoravirus dulcis]AGO82094.1 hypothetical protein pdul_cds_169 [Pandoravirus dulcis]
MTSFDLAAFEAAFPPTGTVTVNGGGGSAPYGAGAPTSAPGVDQHITVLNMSGKRATGLWTTEQERSHFTIENGHILNIHRSGVSPIRTIEISTGGAQPVYSNAHVMPGSTVAIVLNEDGGYSPLAPINGEGGGGGGSDGNDSNATRRTTGTSATGYGVSYGAPTSPFSGNGYAPPSNGNSGGGYGASYGAPTSSFNGNGYAPPSNGNAGGGYGASYAAPASNGGNGGYAPPASGGNGGGNGPLGAAYRALTNAAALSYSPFGWRV